MLHQAISRLVRWSCNHVDGIFDFDEYRLFIVSLIIHFFS